MNLHQSPELSQLIARCRQYDRGAQYSLYKAAYAYAKSIGLRYAANEADADEIVNDAFLKVFTQLDKYDDNLSFAGWLRRIIINTAIDRYRKQLREQPTAELAHAQQEMSEMSGLEKLHAEELLQLVQQLPPAYRMVFVLYAIEGYNHAEIAEKLGISEGTSKSNLAKARQKLQKRIMEIQQTLAE